MVCMKFFPVRKFALVLAVLSGLALPVTAQSVPHLAITVPGGMPGRPVMTGISPLTNGVQITWDGPSGYYQVFDQNRLRAPWSAWGGATNLLRTATITQPGSNQFFRVSGPAPNYAGSKICVACHLNVCRYETNTAHASAFTSPAFLALGGQSNPSCLPCHTVGYGLPTGFVSATATPQLAGVQCENCHGPAANHAANEDDPAVRPRAEIAATVCGGCHAANPAYSNPPTFEEWSASGHSAVVPDALSAMAASTNNLNSCGVCHSGSARLAFINGTTPSVSVPLDYDVPISCAVCHDPHATNTLAPAQLRNPLFSTNDFHLTSADVASVSAFTNQYQASANINLCAQCHNDRGAAWTDTARPPHHSLQYNLLLATVGELAPFYPRYQAAHAGLPASASVSLSGTFYLTNQCAACHMQPDAAPAGAPRHTFAVVTNVCANCHDTAVLPPLPLTAYAPGLSNQIAGVIATLNQWAATKAPPTLTTNGAVAWEYPTADGLAWQTNGLGVLAGWSQAAQSPAFFNGPGAAFQSPLTNYPGVMKARFDLYLVLNDGSMGVHNWLYSAFLLDSAQYFAEQELNK